MRKMNKKTNLFDRFKQKENSSSKSETPSNADEKAKESSQDNLQSKPAPNLDEMSLMMNFNNY